MHYTRNKPEGVSVVTIFHKNQNKTLIKAVVWNKVTYKITKQGLYHTYKRGTTTMHVFSAAADHINFKLLLDGSSLVWKLEEVYDPNIR